MDSRIWRWGLAAVLAVPVAAHAALVDRGEGLIYDDVLDITWLQDANYAQTSGYAAVNAVYNGSSVTDNIYTDGHMGWTAATAWAAGLSYSTISYGTLTDWRLPTMVDTGTPGCNGANTGTDCGYNVQTGSAATTVYSEMASLFYDTLGNDGWYDGTGTATGCSSSFPYCLTNTSFFTNVQSSNYWSGLEFAPGTGNAWYFLFLDGHQSASGKNSEFFAWAVRPGDVAPVPVPAAVWLFGSAVMGLVGLGRRARH